LGIVFRFFQGLRTDDAAEKLKAMVGTTATVVRGYEPPIICTPEELMEV